MVRRQFPRPTQLAQLVRFKRPVWSATTRRLRSALTIEDLRVIARRRTPRGAFDYADGAAEAELSLERARQAFRDIEFHPSVLRDVSTADTGWDVLGARSALPFGIAPTGFTRLMHADGEEAAAAAGIPFAPVHDGHHVGGARRRGRRGRAALVPAPRLDRPRPVDAARRPRGEGRLHARRIPSAENAAPFT